MRKDRLDVLACIAAFSEDTSLSRISKRFKISVRRIKEVWREHYGPEAVELRVGYRLKRATIPKQEEAIRAFLSDEPVKVLATRVGMSLTSLRSLWQSNYSEEAIKARHKRILHRGLEVSRAKSKGKARKYASVEVVCNQCGESFTLTKLQKYRSKRIICQGCRDSKKDRQCPVCGLSCNGAKGLASHLYKLTSDPGHKQYIKDREEAKWEGLVEGRDYVTCRVCGFKGSYLGNHFKVHGLTFEGYKVKYPEAEVSTSASESRRVQSLRPHYDARSFNWGIEDIAKYVDEKGHVIVAEAAIALKAAPGTVLKYCRSLGLPTRNRLAWQRLVLDQAAKAWRASYQWEYSDHRIVNPLTGRVLNFDGFFPKLNVIVEAHGDQHFRYSEAWHGSLESFHEFRERDKFKKRRAEELGYRVIVVRPSDPTHLTEFWNKIIDNPTVYISDDISSIFEGLRRDGFPTITPMGIEAQKALTRLRSLNVYPDAKKVIRPYSTFGTSACASFFPGRYKARHRDGKSVYDAWHDDNLLRRAIRLQIESGHPTSATRVLRALSMFHHAPSVFRPAVAKYVYETYAKGGVVWDPCSGYGGRLLGSVAAAVETYIGTDVEPETVNGCRLLAESLGAKDSSFVYLERAEVFDPETDLDLVFTSPPYYDLETYGTSSNSRVYGSVSDWINGFLLPVMETSFRRLRPGGHLVLNLPSKPVSGLRLDLEASRQAKVLGFVEVESLWMPVRTFKGPFKGEPILVWRRP